MTQRVESLLKLLKSKEYRAWRIDNEVPAVNKEAPEPEHTLGNFCDILAKEKPVIFENDRIGFNRHQKNALKKNTAWGNIVPNYKMLLENGFYGIYKKLQDKRSTADSEQLLFINRATKALDAVLDLLRRYRDAADGELKDALGALLHGAPSTYHEALVMMKALIFTLRIDKLPHITLGRFDQYMYPFYKADIARGITDEQILELTEEFFISINFDSDTYYGIQQGDNGQSMVLGGCDQDGNDCFNELSHICMKASLELNLIDPKINVRVSKKTPMEIYRLGTLLTKQGLGFPQYSNDDVVIPGLLKLGHTPEEAYNYSMAACWEFIMPDRIDITNYGTVNIPEAVNDAVHENLSGCSSFEEFLGYVKKNIDARAEHLFNIADSYVHAPHTYYSLLFAPCLEKFRDYTESGLVCNFGFHGAGIANAADALAAIKKLVFEEKSLSPEELIKALDADFEGYEELQQRLLACPKMGNNDDYADDLAAELMDEYSSYFATRKLHDGGVLRAGTGSAQGYIEYGRRLGATADGRHAHTPLSSSFSPSVTAHTSGLLSVIQSFTKFELSRIINGGPLTIEIHENVFRNDYGMEKVAELVKMYVELGGHQLQLNSISRETLLEAQKHPELHPDLIVRVWGWSGYFNELDIEYQNHIISRMEYTL